MKFVIPEHRSAVPRPVHRPISKASPLACLLSSSEKICAGLVIESGGKLRIAGDTHVCVYLPGVFEKPSVFAIHAPGPRRA